MAYVLGFFVADGSMYTNPRGAHYLDFYITDKELLIKIRKLLKSNHKISFRKRNNPRWKKSYQLQIGSKEMFQDLIKLGITPKKSKTILFPNIPKKYFNHFVRGYFDGDGNVSYCRYFRDARQKYAKHLQAGFISGSKKFLKSLALCLKQEAKLEGGSFCFSSRGYRLYYSSKDTKRLYSFLYNNVPTNCYLRRKFKSFKKAIKNFYGAVA